jgi:hypothetical protein
MSHLSDSGREDRPRTGLPAPLRGRVRQGFGLDGVSVAIAENSMDIAD